MAALITGGAGFIGLEVVRLLLSRGEKRPLVMSRNPSPKRLGGLADEVEVMRGDLGNFSHVLEAVKKARPQVIYHLGATLSVPSEADPASALQTNAMGTFHVLEAARLFNVPQVVFASSVGTYGTDIRDDSIDDATIQRPQLFYGMTKVFGEHMGLFYRRKYGLDFRGIRYPSIIGPGVRTRAPCNTPPGSSNRAPKADLTRSGSSPKPGCRSCTSRTRPWPPCNWRKRRGRLSPRLTISSMA